MADVESGQSKGGSLTASDLARSGLTLQDIRGRELGAAERQATGTSDQHSGYVIPYFTPEGKILPFYRVKIHESPIKYRQVQNTPNHLYFPPGFAQALANANCIILTEGEKKAACAVKAGYACVGVAGVDSWRTRLISIPKNTPITTGNKGNLMIKLPQGFNPTEKHDASAWGLEELAQIAIERNLPIVIIYDTDGDGKLPKQVQSAANGLACELRHRGVPFKNLRGMPLPTSPMWKKEDKIGIDDFLMAEHLGLGKAKFKAALEACLAKPSAFPTHPNAKEYVNKRLQSGKLDRKAMQGLSTVVLSQLDARGKRLICPDDETMFYFDQVKKEMVPVSLRMNDSFGGSPFGVKLYRDFNISMADQRLMMWVQSQFAGEEPVHRVTPRRTVTAVGDTIYVQLGPVAMAKVTGNSIEFLDNGTDDILFDSSVSNPLDVEKVRSHAMHLMGNKGILPNYWAECLATAKLADSEDDNDRKLLALLYSISPWFYRWRGTQLPVEMTIGEAGSGKSSLYVLRQNIISGQPFLRNAPNDIRDWGASVGGSGGLHVTDNMHMTDSKLRQLLSDEMCRVVTEPNPMVERRKLYSDNEQVRTPVNCVFAITAIEQPFTNADLIARAVIVTLDPGIATPTYGAEWPTQWLNHFGGREAWLGHQLVFIQRILQLAQQKWASNYAARYRLANVEQLLILAAEVYGQESDWIVHHLSKSRNEATKKGNWILEGLQEFANNWYESNKSKEFHAGHIADYCADDDGLKANNTLTNARSVGRYLSKNANMVANLTGIKSTREKGNRLWYMVDPSLVVD